MEPIEKYICIFLMVFVTIVLGSVHAYDVITNQKIIGVIENTASVWEKKRSSWETGERYERCIKLKIKLPNKKEEELLLKGNKDETAFLQGERYLIKFRREDGKIIGKRILDD